MQILSKKGKKTALVFSYMSYSHMLVWLDQGALVFALEVVRELWHSCLFSHKAQRASTQMFSKIQWGPMVWWLFNIFKMKLFAGVAWIFQSFYFFNFCWITSAFFELGNGRPTILSQKTIWLQELVKKNYTITMLQFNHSSFHFIQ